MVEAQRLSKKPGNAQRTSCGRRVGVVVMWGIYERRWRGRIGSSMTRRAEWRAAEIPPTSFSCHFECPPPTNRLHSQSQASSSSIMPGQRGPVPVSARDGGRDLTQEILDLLDSKPEFGTADAFPEVPQIEM